CLCAKTSRRGTGRRAEAEAPVKPPFRRILVANRGEIALRIIRAAHEMGMEAVAVYSDADATAAHVRAADAAIRLGPATPADSYLRVDAIVAAAVESGADAVHPGYGFLSERASFAQAVENAGLVFVGPPPGVIAALGDKLAARRIARAADVPHVPGTLEAVAMDRPDQLARVIAAAAGVGFPLLVKAAAGGGGRGIRRVVVQDELPAALVASSREAAASFGDGSVYLEREVMPARHIEVQLLGDSTGQVIALGERDCSTQRRHQKLIEEAPAPGLTETERRRLHAMAVRLGVAAGLQNAATVEFLYDRDGAFWFLEVNTRLQVEHPVTEMVSGIDLVVEQFKLAAGAPLSDRVRAAADRAPRPTSHAIEVRISAEDPARVFAPSPGRITRWAMPAGPGIRVDTAVEAGDRVPPEYDPLICKLIVHAPDRPSALARLRRALDETEIGGIQTTLPFHRTMLAEPAFVNASGLATTWVEAHWDGPASRARAVRIASLAAGLAELGGREAAQVPGMDSGASSEHGPAWRSDGRAIAIDRWPR
ncbi:MAG TPA: biotin carboxylase N-terminal domain-containing protein, partial [Verrucomicrobiae bacterium]|nr:biotin carboxylase N-terminal domain-containing protein [Verrucomicrobiae bacterium]